MLQSSRLGDLPMLVPPRTDRIEVTPRSDAKKPGAQARGAGLAGPRIQAVQADHFRGIVLKRIGVGQQKLGRPRRQDGRSEPF